MNPNDRNNNWGDGSGPPDLEKVLGQMFQFSGRPGRWIKIIAALAVLLWVGLGVYQVEQRERGVVLRLGMYYDTLEAGLHWQPRFIDEVYVVNVTELRTHVNSSIMLTKDENIVNVKLSVQYLVSDPKDYLLAISDPDETLSQASESALRHEVGSNTMDDVLVGRRGPIQAEIQVRLQRYMNDYTSGLQVVKVNIQQADPPEAVREAFNDAIKAREDKNRLSNEAEAYANSILPQARGQSQRLIEEASAERDKAIASARGEAARFLSLYREYRLAPKLTWDRLYIEAMEQVFNRAGKVIIDNSGEGGNLIYLPLDRLRGASSGESLSDSGRYSSNDGTPNSDESIAEERIIERVLNRLRPGASSSDSKDGTYRNTRRR